MNEPPTAAGPHADPDGEFYRRLCRSAPMAVIATDRTRRVVTCNAAAGRLVGITPNLIVGRPLIDVVPANRRRLLEKLLLRTVDRGLTGQFQVRLPNAAGQMRHLMVILSPIPDAEGRSMGVAAWIVDETSRRHLADQLVQAEKMASLGTLAGGVAHHFNNILGGVATFVDYALTSGDVTAMKRALQMTVEAASRASQITQSLLTFAERDQRSSDLSDLTEVVLTFVHLVERPLAEKNIQVRLDLRPVPVIPVRNDQLHRALNNLLANAEEAMPDGGTIDLSIRKTQEDVELAFSDTGCGIDAKNQPMVFEPFFTTKGLLSGGDEANPGLGLSVVHGLVQEMGATIRLDSSPGEGTRLILAFPIARAGDPPPAQTGER